MEKLNKFETVKDILVGAAGAGVATVIMNIVKATSPANMKGITKVLSTIGGIVLSAMATEQSDAYVTRQIESIASKTKEIIEESKELEANADEKEN